MARLDQARRGGNREEGSIVQQRGRGRRPCGCTGRAARDRRQHAGNRRGQSHGRHHQPDQVLRGDDVEQEAGTEAAGDEGDRAPQAHRAIGPAGSAEPAQCIGVGERHDGRVEGGRERERRHDGHGTLRQSDRAVAQRGRRCRDHDRRAQRIMPVGAARRDRDGEDPNDHGDRQHDADRADIEPLGREPDRQERQLHADYDEQSRVKSRQPPGKCGACGYLGIT